MKANNALILLWCGNQPSNYIVEQIMNFLCSSGLCTSEKLTVIYKDKDSIANALLEDVKDENAIANALLKDVKDTLVVKTTNSDAEAVKNAVIYIGRRFEDSLTGANRNLTKFGIELSKAVANAQQRISFNAAPSNGDEILKAVEIISTITASIPQTLARRYHFTQNVVDVIKTVYHSNNV